MTRVTDVNITKNEPLFSPEELCAQIPKTDAEREFISTARREVADCIHGKSDKFLLIVGPCSIHDTEAGLEYGKKLAALAEEVKDKVLIVMRVYFEKPRTTVGWKGLIMDPSLDGSDDIAAGLTKARGFLKEIVDLGLPTATELLDPITPQYIADYICWSAIGARTSESQTHRQMASGLSMPLGFKNATSGDLKAATNGILAASQPQTFLGVSPDGRASAVTTAGNPDCHLILRGGENGPNHTSEYVEATAQALEKGGRPGCVMIDASHANCGKDDKQMPTTYREILEQRANGDKRVIGAMLESFLEAGNQKLNSGLEGLTYGQSITDKCIDWATTEELVRETYAAL